MYVKKEFSVLIFLLGAGSLFPLDGQGPETQVFNFNVGGGLSVPLKPTRVVDPVF
jgi:hypothetical protein